jgi:transposase InsO family protein
MEGDLAGYPRREVLRLLKVDKSSYYRRRQEERQRGRDEAGDKVKEIFLEHKRRYGSRRIQAEMQAEGYKIGRHAVRRRMTELELKAIQPRSFVPRTTNSRHSWGYSPNLLLERGHPVRPLEVIVGDITYLPLRSGKWCYLATWSDLYTRQILGWAVREDMTAELVVQAFKMVIRRTGLPAGCIVHSDRGSQYASTKLRGVLRSKSCLQSMSRTGETYDNAFAESFFSRFKAEVLEGGSFFDTQEAWLESFRYIEGYYNTKRRHSSLGYKTPNAFELDFRQRAARLSAHSSLTEKPIDNKLTKGGDPKVDSCPTF